MRHSLLLFCVSVLLVSCAGPSAVSGSLWGIRPTATARIASPDAPTSLTPDTVIPSETATLPSPTATLIQPTLTPVPSPTRAVPSPLPAVSAEPMYFYESQSGDTLSAILERFQVKAGEITSQAPPPATGLIDPGTLLVIPQRLTDTSPSTRIMPDSEVVYSPTTLDFDTSAYVDKMGGRLSRYTEYLMSTGTTTGAQAIDKIAIENSINPRLLLGLLEYESQWVSGQPDNLAKEDFPLGKVDYYFRGLFRQMMWAVQVLADGYYGWRSGKLTELKFADGRTVRMDPQLNAGSAALQYYFSQRYSEDYDRWAMAIDPNVGFPALYQKMFGDPWQRAAKVDPLFPPGMTQPPLALPFQPGKIWAFTGGPHSAWELQGALAALDFAPPSDASGCIDSSQWVVAPAPGLVVRSGNGVVALDLDGDGHEQTGWVILFLHIATKDRVPLGKFLSQDDLIGHPSCEGGIATGTHVHIARKYNGEWVLADGPLPFDLDGWIAHAGNAPYKGTLVKGDQTVVACTCSSSETHIVREANVSQ